MGPEYVGLPFIATMLLPPFPHHPGQRFSAFIDQFGLTEVRQKVDVAVNLYPLVAGLD